MIDRSIKVHSPRHRPAAYIKDIANICREHTIDLLIPTCEEIFTLAALQKQLPKSVRLFAPSIETLERLHNKGTFIELCEQLGLTTPATLFASDYLQQPNKLPNNLILKPAFSRFGTKVRSFNSHTEAAKFLNRPDGQDYIVQERVEGTAVCSYSICDGGRVLASILYRPIGNPLGGAATAFENISHGDIAVWIESFCSRTKFTGQIAFDFIVDQGGTPRVLECNPRTTSGIHFFDSSITKAICFGEQVIPAEPGQKLALKLACRPAKAFGCQDVMFDREDPLPFFYQIPACLIYMGKAVLHRISLPEATVVDLAWNGGPIPSRRQNSIQATANSLILNARCDCLVIRTSNGSVSCTRPRGGESCYTTSLRAHFFTYAVEECDRLGNRCLSVAGRLLLLPARILLSLMRSEEALFVGNNLLSTNLHDGQLEHQIEELLEASSGEELVVVRSLTKRLNQGLMDRLTRNGFTFVPARLVFLFDPESETTRDLKKDLRHYRTTKLVWKRLEHATPEQYDRIAELYKLLYLEKYTPLNPHLTSAWIKQQHQFEALTIDILSDQSGFIVGVAGTITNGSMMTTPLLGYDSNYQTDGSLYRLLTTHLGVIAKKESKILHRSSGAEEFKLNRGAEPETEYIAIYGKQLSASRRLALSLFALLLRGAAALFFRGYRKKGNPVIN